MQSMGSADHPVRLDPWQMIVEVHWGKPPRVDIFWSADNAPPSDVYRTPNVGMGTHSITGDFFEVDNSNWRVAFPPVTGAQGMSVKLEVDAILSNFNASISDPPDLTPVDLSVAFLNDFDTVIVEKTVSGIITLADPFAHVTLTIPQTSLVPGSTEVRIRYKLQGGLNPRAEISQFTPDKIVVGVV